MRASGIFFCIRIGDFCIVPISVSRRCGHDYAVFRGENRRFFLCCGRFPKAGRIMPPCPFFENAAVREAKSTCFQPRKQMLGAVFGFGSGALPFPLFNPSANQDNGKHSDHNHSGNPYGRKHPYPTPLDNSQQLQHNKDNRQNGYDAKPALFCFIIHIVSLRSPS